MRSSRGGFNFDETKTQSYGLAFLDSTRIACVYDVYAGCTQAHEQYS